MRTIGSELEKYKGLGPGFDFLRIGLATCVVFIHGFWLISSWIDDTKPFWFSEYAVVPMFFVVSGFLVTGSAARLPTKQFLINRGLRILPALGINVVVSALIIGPIMTTLALSDYVSHPDFARYFLNMVGWIHFDLPGVFEDHRFHGVNGALWTVPYEILCYVMAGLIITTALKYPRSLIALTVAYVCAGLFAQFFPSHVPWFTPYLVVERGSQLITAFLCGMIVYRYKDVIPYSRKLAWLAVAVCVAGAFTFDISALNEVPNRIILMPALTYLVAFLGVTPVPVPRFVHRGDYSYGIYLYHDPLLQVIIALIPGLMVMPFAGPLLLLALGLPAAVLFAIFSWHTVEKPILGLRKKFAFVARVRGVADANDVSVAPILPPDMAEAPHIVKLPDEPLPQSR